MKNNKFIKLLTYCTAFSLMVFGYACTDLAVQETDSVFTDGEGGSLDIDPAEALNTNYNDLNVLTQQDNIYSLYAHSSYTHIHGVPHILISSLLGIRYMNALFVVTEHSPQQTSVRNKQQKPDLCGLFIHIMRWICGGKCLSEK